MAKARCRSADLEVSTCRPQGRRYTFLPARLEATGKDRGREASFRPEPFPESAEFHQRMAEGGDGHIKEIPFALTAGGGAHGLILPGAVQPDLGWREFNAPRGRMVFQVEAVDDGGGMLG